MRAEGPGAPLRRALPNRRLNLSEAVAWQGRDWLMCVGFDEDGRVREVFLDGPKQGSDQEAVMTDGCILLSILLQSGVAAPWIADRLGEAGGDPADPRRGAPRPASPIGLVARRLAAVEAESGAMVRAAYGFAEVGG